MVQFRSNKIIIVLVAAFIGLFLLPNNAAALTPSEGCQYTAYSFDGNNHYSLLKNNSSLIGSEFNIESNCDKVEVYSNNKFIFGSYSNGTFNIPLDTNEIKIITFYENTSKEWVFEGIFVFPSSSWGDFLEGFEDNLKNPVTLSLSDLQNEKIVTVIISSLIIWFISTFIIWRVVNFYVDRFHFEEVV